MKKFDSNWTPFTPVARERVTEGEPETRLAEAVSGEGFKSGLWEVTPGRFTTAPRGFDEVIHIISGSGVLRSADGSSVELAPGVSFLMEDGFVGEWEIREQLQKFYAKVQTATAD
ncbi:cupin domain-containing protein [Mycolicibacterium smegmatis]|uniref:cupin domain-containing protein n=1 Tax=Mycolicibacterium smegmatis TaxID=1772 RepID=UPI0005D9708D|nr:cupin domain-containing protein [Mycolicibacterium smegmatis]MDF1900788.1 cupin domain-containing protein [Mycolicibacterium smegmatis]MDF1907067.1 cupin domain-containing protein [Mycolicibacterium smegmatis]MDF1919262.1 cupin domain-containing protein [Mycolicibacterium smegmatis]MDF1925329.1 cupin domain-containing protein [Mycolicibacterium smegmatis]UAK52884.1 cupin domain-containing protein [Mycolicibacterium smegmatis]